jgi:energy-coupling factor transporter ATP-binding protein EcfA2
LENQLISCEACNQRFKKTYFPVEKTRQYTELANQPVATLNKLEGPLLLNPFDVEPSDHFSYKVINNLKHIRIEPLTPRASVTIDILGLNRPDLAGRRYQHFRQLKLLQEITEKVTPVSPETKEKIAARFKSAMTAESEFAGMARFFFLQFAKKHAIISKPRKTSPVGATKPAKQLAAVTKETAVLPAITAQGLIIDNFIPCEIEISNFKSISKLHLRFRDLTANKQYAADKHQIKIEDVGDNWQESWLLLLGENGVGKSSVLQAIVLALLPEAERNKYIEDPKALVKKGTQKGFVKIQLGDKEPVEMHFTKGGKITGNIHQYNDFLLAYGATRLLPKGKLQPEPNTSKIKVQNLFDYSIALENAIEWLLQRNKKDFIQAARFLKDLLFLKEDLLCQDGKIYTNENGSQLELGWLSDGHKTLLALAVDMLKTFATQRADIRYTDVQQYASGMVLIDEIGTHLHPRWKMKIVEQLRNALPKVFFIVTSHEPLCMRGLRDKEVVVLKRDDDTGEINALADLPSPDGLRVDQLLTSRYFGLNSTIDTGLEDKFKRYYDMLGKPEKERTPEDTKAITGLQHELDACKQLGDNLREELFYYAVDELIAKNLRNPGKMKTNDELKPEVKKRIETLLKEIDLNISSK